MRDALRTRCQTIEECYEFTLAYAAQGVAGEAATGGGSQIRMFLTRAEEAITGLAEGYAALVEQERLEPRERYEAFLAVLDRDARAALAVVQLVLAQSAISSQLVDNLNASMHVRALLTDLFVIDEILRPRRTDPGAL